MRPGTERNLSERTALKMEDGPRGTTGGKDNAAVTSIGPGGNSRSSEARSQGGKNGGKAQKSAAGSGPARVNGEASLRGAAA